FNVALELSITWINRILLLKLLEAQLVSYHRFDKRFAGQDDKSFAFLNTEKIKDYDDLNSLFFQVLAKQHSERNEDVSKAFAKVPYLNSSLFEPTEMEQQTIFISNLKDDKTIPVLASTVLKDQQGKKRTGSLNTLNYLFEFLDAYDFSSEGQEEIQEENKSLINASVLGLIFEKINGYKDGSFFTPGFITMYMSRQTIRKAVVQKFNETKNWNCHDLDELYDRIDDRREANEIVNSLKICDPAVGSGHFLVSALNEMIAIKHDLKILQDRNGRRLKEYQVEVVNDELIVTDEEGQLFDYNPNSPESQRVQQSLFHEKQSLIENCLFGVDINPNSVKICRLRLWIELLKNAYYKNDTELETLPNIDINIKCGNSLVSRFDIQSDLKQALRKSKWSIASYRVAVDTYRNAQNKEQKWEMERLIADIKSNFRSEISGNDPKLKKLNKLKGELLAMTTQHQLFEMNEKEKAAWNKQLQKHTSDIQKLEAEIEAIKANKIFENAFEWRFEFPEVLNEEGDFVGFDVVIGNPPYLTGSAFKHLHEYLNSAFKTAEYQLDLYTFFIELSHNLLKSNGLISLITPNSWLKNLRMSKTRKFVLDNFNLISINPNIAKAFSEAQVDTLIFISKRCSSVSNSIDIFDFDNNFHAITKNLIEQSRFSHNESFVFDVEVDNETSHIITKIREQSSYLEEVFEITRGVNPYDKYRGQSQEIIKSRAYHSSFKKDETFLPELKGKHVSTFHYKWDNKHFISYGNWLAAPREPRFFTGIRLLFREIIGKRFVCTCIEEDFIIDRSLYIALPKDENVDVWGTLGVLCSKLLIWLFRYEKNEFDELFPKVRLEEFKKLPVPEQDKLINIGDLVKKVTQLKNENIDTDAIESQIDQLVYQLYGLTEEEIAIVEGS
ncbi:MAG: TaqI-like C-terminal specificity domain-containing protein, partial [Bacteroidales bacterium]